jgi:putative acetyltransferase
MDENPPMIQLRRTDSSDPEFRALVVLLDAELAERDGIENDFYAQFNRIDLKHVVIAADDGKAIACGAMKEYAPDTMEVKRMFTSPENRGRGIASIVLNELERWAGELGYTRFILETGKRQPEAIAVYTRNGYDRIPNYDQYVGIENSVCFAKELRLK